MGDYDTDILIWAERQAQLLRQLAEGRRTTHQVDWENVIEEIESVGRSELNAVASHLIQALLHDLKAEAWPHSPSVAHWRAEARGQTDDARRIYAPSMKNRPQLDVRQLYSSALRRMPETIDGQPALPVPTTCPWTLEELLADDGD